MLKEIRYYYLRKGVFQNGKIHNIPFGVIAYNFNADGTVNRGFSFCSVSDNFNKKTGKSIAVGRLKESLKDKQSVEIAKYKGKKAMIPKDMLDECGINSLRQYGATPLVRESVDFEMIKLQANKELTIEEAKEIFGDALNGKKHNLSEDKLSDLRQYLWDALGTYENLKDYF